MKRGLWVVVVLVLVGCGSSKPIPAWLSAGNNQLENYKKHFLTGQEAVATLQFQDALQEIKKSGDLELLARSYLIRMALQRATLQDLASAEYLQLEAAQPSPANRHYYALLQGDLAQVDAKLLPAQYLAFVESLRQPGNAGRLQAIEHMEDPLSQLVAVGLLVRLGQEDEAVLQKAVAIASAEGWKKALLAYLGRMQVYYSGKQEGEKGLAVQKRIDFIKD